MYNFFTNSEPLFRCNESYDTLYGEVEKSRLVNWDGLSFEELDKILPGCTDTTLREKAQNFFKKCLHGDIEQRHKNMTDILEDPLFSGADVDLKELNENFEKLAVVVEKEGKKIREVVSEEAEKTREDIKLVSSKLDDLNIQLDMFKKATMISMRKLISGHELAPAMMMFVPKKNGINPADWLNKEVKVMFICPVTMRVPKDIDGKPLHYTVKLIKGWVKIFGPTILMTLNVLKVACGIGNVAGIAPLKLADGALNIIAQNSSTLTSMYDELKNMPQLKPTHEFIEEMYKKPDELNRAKSLEGTHGAIAVSKIYIPKDSRFQNSGLVLATDMDGKSEYIHKDIKLVVEEYGFEKCLKMSTEDLYEKQRKLWEKAKKKEHEHESLFKERKEKNKVVDNEDILAEGYMEKKGLSIVSKYDARYFILKTDGSLFYYLSESDALNSAFYGHKRLLKVERVNDTNKMRFAFENSNDKPPIIQKFRIDTNQNDDCNKWIEAAEKITRVNSESGNATC